MKGQECQGCAAETLWSQPKLAIMIPAIEGLYVLAVFFLMLITNMSYWKSEQYQQISTDLEFSQVYLSDGFILFTAFTWGKMEIDSNIFCSLGWEVQPKTIK